MSSWSVVALGTPAPQGSKRHVGGGVMVESSKAVKPWRESVKAACPPGPTLDGPIVVAMVFTMRRPKSARRRDTRPSRTPDLSKLARSTEDALVDAGLLVDDARIQEYYRLAKVWTGFDPHALETPGVLVAAIDETEELVDLADLLDDAITQHRRAWITREREPE